MSRLYQLVTRWIITCSIPLVSVLVLFPEKVMLLFGPDYLPAASILVVLTLAAFIQTVLGAAGPTLSMSGFTHLVFRNSLGAFYFKFSIELCSYSKIWRHGCSLGNVNILICHWIGTGN